VKNVTLDYQIIIGAGCKTSIKLEFGENDVKWKPRG
jgi:hypothetical protein